MSAAARASVIQRIRNFLIGKDYNIQARYPNDQAKRTQPDVNLPPGFAHKLSANYYGLTRDYRRDVSPPKTIVPSQLQLSSDGTSKGTVLRKKPATPNDVYQPL